MKNSKLTSVKVLDNLYNHFRLNTVNSDMTLQKLTNRCIYEYLNNEDFRDKIDNFDELELSGSNY